MNSMIKKERNYWPYGIIGMLIFIVCVCVLLVKIAVANPPQMDNFYFKDYQLVDEDINDILERQKIFEENFALIYKTKKFIIGEKNSFKMSIKNKTNQAVVKNAKIELLVTRPDTNSYNQKFTIEGTKDGIFIFDGIEVGKPGRWKILTKIYIDDKSSFNTYEIFATN